MCFQPLKYFHFLCRLVWLGGGTYASVCLQNPLPSLSSVVQTSPGQHLMISSPIVQPIRDGPKHFEPICFSNAAARSLCSFAKALPRFQVLDT